MTRAPQFRDNYIKSALRQRIRPRKVILLALYYCLAKNMPFGTFLRSFLAKNIFKKFGRDVTIHRGCVFGSGVNVEIGDFSSLNVNCCISNDTIIGDDVMMGESVLIISGSHNFERIDISMREQDAPKRRPVVIKNDVWVGARSIILPGVNVGSHVIIGAGSIVTKNIPDYAIVAGNPAKLIRYRK